MNKNCKLCNSEFQITKDRLTYCSHKCQAKDAIKKANLVKKPRLKTGKYLICKICIKEYYVQLNRINKSKYCSRSCLAKDLLPKYVEVYGFKKTGKSHAKYITIKVDGIRVRLHRYLMEQHLGRKLETWEHVHHINNDSLDNRLENLTVLSNSEHQKIGLLDRKKLISS